ncbi:hypothetical protein Sjap_020660 [Stephania japonica]|uniref:RING-type domain-containing protein n=1 Tax=Stephania japonica TaxID=461633 RepID=A0AAP0F2C6_9MAGN
MRAITESPGSHQVEVHYVNAGVPGFIEGNFEGFLLDHGDLSPEEVLLQQEIVYESLRTNSGINGGKASVSTGSDVNRSDDQILVVVKTGESSEVIKSQLELDEALAMHLQDLENQLENASLDDDVGREADNREVNHSETSRQAVTEDNIDPDNMTYEQLQSLGETVGVESRGLSDELISYLPSFKYKTGLFSKKEKLDDCVICCTQYKNRDMITTLPCQHQYHSECITKWLKLNKTCPVCTSEVFGS